MKCTNCHSTDLVSIQGQSYCINCGQLVLLPKQTLKKTSVSSPGSNAKSHGDQIPVSEPEALPNPELGMSGDIKSGNQKTNVLNLRAPEKSKQSGGHDKVATNLQGHPWRISAQIALLTALPSALALGVGLHLKLDTDIVVFAIGPAIVLAVASAATLAQAAVMYGVSKRQDGRPVPASQWWNMATQSATELLQLNVFTVLALIVCAAAGLGAWRYSWQWMSDEPMLRGLLLLAINTVIIWAGSGVLIARRLSEAAIVINDVPLGLAIRLGFGMYWRVGGHLMAAAAQSLAVSAALLAFTGALITAVMLARNYVPLEWHAVLYSAGLFVGLFGLIAVSLHIETRMWVAQYRHWAPVCYPDKRVQDLTTPRVTATKPT